MFEYSLLSEGKALNYTVIRTIRKQLGVASKQRAHIHVIFPRNTCSDRIHTARKQDQPHWPRAGLDFPYRTFLRKYLL